MPDNVKTQRRYTSSIRQEQAKETRLRILDAARRLFLARGHAATTVEAIAKEASVAVQTVYAGFGTKRGILIALLELSIGGDDQPIEVLERPDPLRMRDELDQRRQLEMMAEGIRKIMERAGPVFTVVRAAVADPEIATRYERLQEDRLRNMTRVVGWVAARGPLREGLSTAEAADIMWMLTSADVHRLLTIDRGWTMEQYERWLGDTMIASLLP
ncbi:MAG: TetR/AcrR family transcriptional regulator [Chloroflexota bacterium]|nr:TetR/AcrR family transcriptional regulator [Chloroflexota bacterium]